jgi:hypothetical protein
MLFGLVSSCLGSCSLHLERFTGLLSLRLLPLTASIMEILVSIA